MAIIINGATGIDMGNTSVSNASKVDSVIINENGLNVATNNNLVGFKNYIINGKKVVNQRGLTSTDNSYNQDRWYKAGNNWFQGIEGDNNLVSGKTYTLSFVGAAAASYYVGTATSSTINAQTFTSIANGGNFTLTISAGQNLWIKFASDATGSTFNFVQLEEGLVATPFEHRPYGLELMLCQRYYEIGSGYGLSYASSGTSYQRSVITYKVSKRLSPSIVVTKVSGDATTPGVSMSVDTMFVVAFGSTSASLELFYTYAASAEL